MHFSKISAQLYKLKSLYYEFPRQFWIIAFGVLISSAGSSMIWPFQLIYVSNTLAMPISAVTTLITISSITALSASPLGGFIADRFGRRNLMIFAQVSHGLAYVLMSFAHSYVGFLIPMTLIGAAMPLYSVGSDAMMADMIPTEKRSSAYSVLRMINNTGIAIGPAIGGIIVARSYQLGFIIAAIGMFGYGIYLTFFVKETLNTGIQTEKTEGSEHLIAGYLKVFADKKYLAFLSSFTIGIMAPMLLWMLLAVYTNKFFAIKESQYSLIPMTNAIMCVFIQYPITLLIRKMETRRAITLGMFFYAIGVGSVALMTSFWGFWLSMVIMTFGELIAIPTATKFIADLAPADLRGRYMSLYWLSWGISRAFAPLLGGILYDQVAPIAIWWGGLTLGLISTIILFIISKNKSFQIAS
jgi:MFS family permease